MTDKILLTVVVTVYNLEGCLSGAMDSVLAIPASLPAEIIAVDNGSTDGSPAILQEYVKKDPRVRVITQGNSGVSGARNSGIEAAKGKYIAFVDGDDTAIPEFFPEAVREAEQGGFDIVQGNARYMEDGQVRMVIPGCERRSSGNPAELMEWFFGREEILLFSVWGKIYRRESIGEVRFTPGIRVAEDQLFLFRLLKKDPKVLILNLDAYHYILRNTSVTNSQYAEKGWDAIRVLDECEKDTEDPVIRKYITKRKTDVLVRIYNTAKLTKNDEQKALAEIRKYRLREFRETLSRKEFTKLLMLKKSPFLYNFLLKIVKN